MSKLEGFDEMTYARNKALVIKLGGMPVVERLLREDVHVEFEDESTARVVATVKPLFDKHGRCIPANLVSAVCDANRSFRLEQHPVSGSPAPLDRLQQYAGQVGIPAVEFASCTTAAFRRIREHKQLANLLNGTCLPICIPQIMAQDYGTSLLSLVEAAGRSYGAQFPGRKFYNHRRSDLTNQVTIVEGSRHDRLVEAVSAGPVVGLYFPTALQGFSVLASREQMNTLPDDVLLAGGLDTACAMVMYPDVLSRDYQTPLLDMAALSWQSPGCSLYFRASGDELVFDYRASLGDADDGYSGGLFVLG